jgi:acyl carrier protein
MPRSNETASPATAPGAPPEETQVPVEDVLRQCLGSCGFRPADVSLDDRLEDLGFESLRFVQLVVLLETSLNVEFADERLDYRGFERVRDVLAYVQSLPPV